MNHQTNTPTQASVAPQGQYANKWVSLLLCIFLGYLGAHKFYERKYGMGVLYLVTLGLFGIGCFVDFVLILCKPNPYYVGKQVPSPETSSLETASNIPTPVDMDTSITDSIFSVSIESNIVEKDIYQRTRGELPMADVGGYVSPSGGFMNYGRFRVSGKNIETGRKNTRQYETQDEEAAKALAVADGLSEPFTVEVKSMEEPTERQLEYAYDLEAVLPEGVSKWDVSAIISRIVDDDEAAPDPGLSRYAHDSGVMFSRFVGHDALLGCIVKQLSGADLATFYAYAVYLREKGGDMSDPRQLPIYAILRKCGESITENPKLLKSLEERTTGDFRTPSKNTNIYKITTYELQKHGVL